MEKNNRPLIIAAMVIGVILIIALALIFTRGSDETTTETANENKPAENQENEDGEENGEESQPLTRPPETANVTETAESQENENTQENDEGSQQSQPAPDSTPIPQPTPPLPASPQPTTELSREPLVSTEFPSIQKLLGRLELTDEAKNILEDVQIGFYYKTIEDGRLRGDADCVQIVSETFPDQLASDNLTSFFELNLDDTNKQNICLYLGKALIASTTLEVDTINLAEESFELDLTDFDSWPNTSASWYHHNRWPDESTWAKSNSKQYWLYTSDLMRSVVDRINSHLAHEILHAIQFYFIYIEPDDSEVARIQALVNDLPKNPPENFEQFPDHSVVEWRWTDYEKRLNDWFSLSYDGHPQQYEHELYAIVGGIVRNLSPELENHYSRFFKNRARVIRMFEWAYNAPSNECQGGGDNTLEECQTYYAKHFQEWDSWWGSNLL